MIGMAKTVTPRPEFYTLFSKAQIYDIVRNLEVYHEVPRQYNYFDKGASNWDKHVQLLAAASEPNGFNQTAKLLDENLLYIDKLLENFKRVNVIDIGPGNALPVKEFLDHLLKSGKLNRYIALDVSKEMLHIVERNIKKWFNGKVAFEGYEMDIGYEHFASLVAEDYLAYGRDTMSLVLFLGGTLSNLRNPDDAFNTINHSMNRNDILILDNKLETENKQPDWFRLNPTQNSAVLTPNHRFIFDLLNIDPTCYDVEMGFDPQLRQKYLRVRLKMALTIKLTFGIGEYLLQMDKGETILLWRFWEVNAHDVEYWHKHNGFDIISSSESDDGQDILTVSRIKIE